MITNKQQLMFESVARGNPQLREWLLAELDRKIEVLIQNRDGDVLRQAQGYAQCLQTILGHLDQSTGSPRRRAGSST